MDDGGWIKLWRKTLYSPKWQALTPYQKCVMITCLLKANWEEKDWYCKQSKEKVKIPRGSFITSIRGLAIEASVSTRVCRTSLLHLARLRFLTQQSTQHYTMISIINYDRYQQDSLESDTATDTHPTHTRHTPDTDIRSIRSNKKVKKYNTSDIPKEPPSEAKKNQLPEQALTAADELRSSILQWKPNHRLSKDRLYKREKWAREIDLMSRLDDRPWGAINKVIKWLPSDRFWPKVIQSPEKLRAHFDALEDAMNNPSNGSKYQKKPEQIKFLTEDSI